MEHDFEDENELLDKEIRDGYESAVEVLKTAGMYEVKVELDYVRSTIKERVSGIDLPEAGRPSFWRLMSEDFTIAAERRARLGVPENDLLDSFNRHIEESADFLCFRHSV